MPRWTHTQFRAIFISLTLHADLWILASRASKVSILWILNADDICDTTVRSALAPTKDRVSSTVAFDGAGDEIAAVALSNSLALSFIFSTYVDAYEIWVFSI